MSSQIFWTPLEFYDKFVGILLKKQFNFYNTLVKFLHCKPWLILGSNETNQAVESINQERAPSKHGERRLEINRTLSQRPAFTFQPAVTIWQRKQRWIRGPYCTTHVRVGPRWGQDSREVPADKRKRRGREHKRPSHMRYINQRPFQNLPLVPA